MASEFFRCGMTMRTPAGRVDLVPLLRRLDGDKTAVIVDFERDAAVLALTHLGVATHLVHAVVNTSYEVTRGLLAKYGMEPILMNNQSEIAWTSVAHTSSAQRRARRMAERIEVGGRMFHQEAPHGTDLGYTDFGCHCEPCTAAHAAKLADDRAKRRKKATA